MHSVASLSQFLSCCLRWFTAALVYGRVGLLLCPFAPVLVSFFVRYTVSIASTVDDAGLWLALSLFPIKKFLL